PWRSMIRGPQAARRRTRPKRADRGPGSAVPRRRARAVSSAHHSHSPSPMRSRIKAVHHGPPAQRAAPNRGSPTPAVSQRGAMSEPPATLHHPAEAALPPLIIQDRPAEVVAVKLGPVHGGNPELRVGQLPEEEVADAPLAPRADAQVGIGQSVSVKVVGKNFFGDPVGGEFARENGPGQFRRRPHNLSPTAV